MTIKTLEYIHGMLLDQHHRLSAEAEKARKKVEELETYYDVRGFHKDRGEVVYTVDDKQEEWEAGGKAAYAVAIMKRNNARERKATVASVLEEFEAQDFR